MAFTFKNNKEREEIKEGKLRMVDRDYGYSEVMDVGRFFGRMFEAKDRILDRDAYKVPQMTFLEVMYITEQIDAREFETLLRGVYGAYGANIPVKKSDACFEFDDLSGDDQMVILQLLRKGVVTDEDKKIYFK